MFFNNDIRGLSCMFISLLMQINYFHSTYQPEIVIVDNFNVTTNFWQLTVIYLKDAVRLIHTTW